jgi:hypothetical protein
VKFFKGGLGGNFEPRQNMPLRHFKQGINIIPLGQDPVQTANLNEEFI